MEYELLRSFIITAALFNSFVIGKHENKDGCSGKRRYFASLYVGTVSSAVFLSAVLCARLGAEYLSNTLSEDAVGLWLFAAVTVAASLLSSHVGRMTGFRGYGKVTSVNSAFLGTMLLFSSDGIGDVSFLRALVFTAYFIPSLLLFSRIRTRLDESESVPCFAGFPVMLLSGGFLSLALSGVAGIVKNFFS